MRQSVSRAMQLKNDTYITMNDFWGSFVQILQTQGNVDHHPQLFEGNVSAVHRKVDRRGKLTIFANVGELTLR
jgi:hypothetical protein